ncbi:MAG TPA: cytochrome C oxidase subunit IV family protein [bacterium]|jgi:cytochrome c oxidase subunit 4
MSNEHSPHAAHALPLRIYLSVGAALLILTAITVSLSFVHLGPFNLVVALSIATIKATLVALFFMHLLYDNKLYLLIFVFALIILGIFIILTLFDTMRRGDLYLEVAKPIQEQSMIYGDSTRFSSPAPEH